MLSAIISRTVGQSTYEYLKPKLFEPLGIRGEEWTPGPQDITPGANGLSWHTADSLKLGILHLQEGRWNGSALLPDGWASAVHAPHVPGKYGYQWWLGPNGAYYADGMFGQFTFVFPNEDAVLAVTASNKCDKLVWQHFPKAFQTRAVAMNARDDEALRAREAQLRIAQPLAAGASPRARQVSGRTFVCEENADGVSTIRLDFSADSCLFTLIDERGEHTIRCGLQQWHEAFTTMTGDKLHHEYQPALMRIVAGGTWVDSDTFEMTWHFVESAFRDTVTCHFDGRSLLFNRRVNVNSAALTRPAIRAAIGS
jgi:hypothetical protein